MCFCAHGFQIVLQLLHLPLFLDSELTGFDLFTRYGLPVEGSSRGCQSRNSLGNCSPWFGVWFAELHLQRTHFRQILDNLIQLLLDLLIWALQLLVLRKLDKLSQLLFEKIQISLSVSYLVLYAFDQEVNRHLSVKYLLLDFLYFMVCHRFLQAFCLNIIIDFFYFEVMILVFGL